MNALMDNMPFVSLFVFGVICFFPGEYRRTAFILFLAFIVNISLLPVYTWMVETDNPDVDFICGGIDALTAYLILMWGGKDKVYQGGILIAAVLMNAVSLISVGAIPSIIFNYIIFIMNLAQILIVLGGIYGKRIMDIYKGVSINISRVRANYRDSHNMEKIQ